MLVLGLITTVTTDLSTKSTTSPKNVIYSYDYVDYFPLSPILITQSKNRGFPFISQTKVVTKYVDEGIINHKLWVQAPSTFPSTGSNSFTRILLTWQFYADILTWMIAWSLLGYSIKSVKRKKA